MKTLAILLICVQTTVAAQSPVRELRPTEIRLLDLSGEGAARSEKDRKIFDRVVEKINNGTKAEDLTAEEHRVWDETDETQENYWDIIGGGCSWYCGGGPSGVTASSQLPSQGSNSYNAGNAHDLSYKTAWVEGVPGYGIGEFLTYWFSPESPRITDIIIVNGYVKSEKAYVDNSRVKKLKVYLNDKPFVILHLEDKRSAQIFKFSPIGNGNRENLDALRLQPGWALKFEILDVYKGLKYDDVAITEIYFDGLDVH